MKPFGITLIFITALFAVATFAIADQADLINKAIAQKGYNWVAKDNPVARAHVETGMYTPGLQACIEAPEGEFRPFIPVSKAELPASFDWRDVDGKNYVSGTPRDQGDCGSCWAFATTGPIEIAVAYAHGWENPNLDFSEQQLVSCSKAGSCDSGGLTTTSFKYAQETGLTSEDCFPYQALNSWEWGCENMCPSWEMDLYKIDEWQLVSVAGFSVDDIKAAILQAPVAASMLIYEDFYYFHFGVYEHTSWNYQGMHAVTLIGWEDENECWIARNSWGKLWGDNGYFRIRWGNSLIGSMSILPIYTAPDLPESDDDDDDTTEEEPEDEQPVDNSSDDSDDDDSGCCG